MSPKTLKTRIAFIVTGTGRNWFNCADNVSFYNVARRKGSDVQSIIRTPDGLAGGRPLAEASRPAASCWSETGMSNETR